MKLYYSDVLNPRRVCAFAKHIEAPVDYVWVELSKGEHLARSFRAMNPNARVPVLQDGDQTIWESDAIMVHLARKLGSDLWPECGQQVEVIRWLSWNQVHFQPYGGAFYFENIIKKKFGLGPPDEAVIAENTKPFQRAAKVLDAHLDGRETLVGDRWTIADFSVSSVLPFAEDAQLPLEAYPNIRAWRDRLAALPAWRDPYPAREAQPAA